MEDFKGPVFIVGMPRSGTKLLRSLLNNHPRLVFPIFETDVLPYWASRWDEYGDLTDFDNFKAFYEDCRRFPFFYYVEARRRDFSAEKWFRNCTGGGISEVFEALVRTVTNAYSDDIIWGDKSPSYVRHIPLLRRLFPDAKIIHIVRDARDYCLSMNKTWGKNMLRAAQRWQDDTEKASRDIQALGKSGMEVRFEDILRNPREEISRVCEFLGVEFDESMLDLENPIEPVGDAKGEQRIVSDNRGKWQTQMKPGMQEKIERICSPQLRHYGYPCRYDGPPVRIGRVRMTYYRLLDAVNLIRSDPDSRAVLLKNLRSYVGAFGKGHRR